MNRLKIYVIESPSAINIFENHLEGHSLCAYFDLANIEYNYYLVVNLDLLANAFDDIYYDCINSKEPKVPVIHISAHGDENGFDLTSDEEVLWESFSSYLIPLNTEDRLLKSSYSEIKYSPIMIGTSICKGINGIRMKNHDDISPFSIFVGQNDDVEWADSLIAFSTYYHLVMKKKEVINWPQAVKIMNFSAGVADVFSYKLGNEFLKVIKDYESKQ